MSNADQNNAVGFVRSTEGFSKQSLERAAHARLRMENYYKNLMQDTIERNKRWV
jgi:protein-serine/threonine kinase